MKVTVRFIPSRETREVELGEDATGMSLVEQLGLTPDAHILVRHDKPIPIDDRLEDEETVTLISVVSGG